MITVGRRIDYFYIDTYYIKDLEFLKLKSLVFCWTIGTQTCYGIVFVNFLFLSQTAV